MAEYPLGAEASALDPFNVRVFNTLNLYEKTIANDYVTVDGTTFDQAIFPLRRSMQIKCRLSFVMSRSAPE